MIGESLKNIELSDTKMFVKNHQYNTEKLEQEYHKLVWNELNKGSVEYGSLCKHEGSF